jgi:hypothetical protein
MAPELDSGEERKAKRGYSREVKFLESRMGEDLKDQRKPRS